MEGRSHSKKRRTRPIDQSTVQPTTERRNAHGRDGGNSPLFLHHLVADSSAESSPKRIYYGGPGSGKSHTMLYVANHLEQKGFKYIYIECPPLLRNSRPVELFKIFLQQYGRNNILDLLRKSYDSVMNDASARIKDLWKDPKGLAYDDLMNMFYDDNFVEILSKYVSDEKNHQQLWDWLNGLKPKDVQYC